MEIVLYKNLSDNRYVSKQIDPVTTAQIVLLENDSTDVPIVVLNMFENYNTPNYAYVAEFGRYYYITNTEILTGRRVRYTLKCDVLMSFAVDIKNSWAILSRGNNQGNVLIDDSAVAFRCDDIVTNLAFNNSELLAGVDSGNYSFVLSTFGGENSGA